MNHFILVKLDGFNKSGGLLSSVESCDALLDFGYWPLWNRTPNFKTIQTGDKALVYAGSGVCSVLATCEVEVINNPTTHHFNQLPLIVDGIPGKMLKLKNIIRFENPVSVRDHLDDLDLCPKNKSRWGVALMGGLKKLSKNDFNILSGST